MPPVPRRHRAPSITVLLVVLAIIAGAMGAIGAALAVLEHTRLTRQVARIDDLTSELAGVQHHQALELERITDARREAILVVCRETEALKVDVRIVLRQFGVQPRDLPINPQTRQRAFTPRNCRLEVLRLVPDPRRPATPEAELEHRGAGAGH